jgi:DNA-binding NarL/FixJ family response regulator
MRPGTSRNRRIFIDSLRSSLSTWHVSKHRPSKRRAAASTSLRPVRGGKADAWLGRVFHNTYTRMGRRVALRGWSIKLQRHGRRRTFRLAARTRAAAATEAQAIHHALLSKGWDAIEQQYAPPNRAPFPQGDLRHWRDRLLLRPFSFPGAPRHEFSTRIDHGGHSSYFPLGVADAQAAAANALSIYRTVLTQGWDVARQMFRRELTVAFHWMEDPVLWTYVTLHTVVDERPGTPSGIPREQKSTRRILLAETDAALCHALEWCINQNEGCRCVVCAEASSEQALNSRKDAALCLMNRNLADRMRLPAKAGILTSGVPVLTYAVHTDSNDVFVATPGGVSGYGLKRTPPHRILEPIIDASGCRAPSPKALREMILSYFQKVFRSDSASSKQASRALTHLTQREQDVLNLLSKGHVDKDIAQTLGISTWTVHEHVKRIFDKLQVHSRTEAALANLQK